MGAQAVMEAETMGTKPDSLLYPKPELIDYINSCREELHRLARTIRLVSASPRSLCRAMERIDKYFERACERKLDHTEGWSGISRYSKR